MKTLWAIALLVLVGACVSRVSADASDTWEKYEIETGWDQRSGHSLVGSFGGYKLIVLGGETTAGMICSAT